MKKWKIIVMLALMAGSLAGCSKKFEPTETTVKLNKDGTLQTAVIDTLDKDYYSADELQTTIDSAVAQYNGSTEEPPIVVKKYEVVEDTVNLYMDYATAADYQEFNEVIMYAADLQGAYDNSYEFPETFQQVEKGKVTGTVTKDEILSGLNYYVMIYSEEIDVEVPGNIVYVSPNVTVTGKKTATNVGSAQAAETETETDTEENVTEDVKVEEGSFEMESAGETEEETETETEKAKDTYTFIIYE